ncbi:uncharacterized protein LOC115743131 isoform X1 [Rhodamnia argentea]|uniref:Uncharacterized protein LOC115743131 isoform X1 n=1 Tax=Rhodamnia argentea TaxID=178133 RepID=A0A8B8PFP8_9MYRT|nr:uncharacterized protein LOC115743131 isoform X1 [Rhodamnia argentea]
MASPEATKLEVFLAWLQANGVQLRGCRIKYCDSTKGYGVFASGDDNDGVLMVVPLDLAITPMRVLQDPLLGPECRAMFEEGEVDDRFLMILYLTVERLRNNSPWKPYLNMLPTKFNSPLWFTDDEVLELKGTALYRATQLQRKQLLSLYEDKAKCLVKKFLALAEDSESDVSFEDFLWANSVFWTRALNIPFPHSYVFPKEEDDEDADHCEDNSNGASGHDVPCRVSNDMEKQRRQHAEASTSTQEEKVWVEGLVPGIDFCNHDFKPGATWEVDNSGSTTGVPFSMYLVSALQEPFENEKEVRISYGNKGNEELLYLYGFVIDNNPDDYLMVHYPAEAIQSISCCDTKMQLLEAQKADLRCLLPRSLLDHGLFPTSSSEKGGSSKCEADRGVCSYSWSGQRRMPSYINKMVFPENFLTALRTIAMQENNLFQVSEFLEELVGSEEKRQPTDTEVGAAVWEVCGDSGALQLLVDLLQTKMLDLEEGTGTESFDAELLKKIHISENPEQHMVLEKGQRVSNGLTPQNAATRNKWSAIVYRQGQKELTRLFLREAEYALQLALTEGN